MGVTLWEGEVSRRQLRVWHSAYFGALPTLFMIFETASIKGRVRRRGTWSGRVGMCQTEVCFVTYRCLMFITTMELDPVDRRKESEDKASVPTREGYVLPSLGRNSSTVPWVLSVDSTNIRPFQSFKFRCQEVHNIVVVTSFLMWFMTSRWRCHIRTCST